MPRVNIKSLINVRKASNGGQGWLKLFYLWQSPSVLSEILSCRLQTESRRLMLELQSPCVCICYVDHFRTDETDSNCAYCAASLRLDLTSLCPGWSLELAEASLGLCTPPLWKHLLIPTSAVIHRSSDCSHLFSSFVGDVSHCSGSLSQVMIVLWNWGQHHIIKTSFFSLLGPFILTKLFKKINK